MRAIQGLLERRARQRDLTESCRTSGQQRVLSKVAQFKRGVPVAYRAAPHVQIGEVLSPPTIHNQRTLIRLATGGQQLLGVNELEVWASPV